MLFINFLPPPPPLAFIHNSKITTYTAGSTRRAAFGVHSAVWRGQASNIHNQELIVNNI